MRQMPWIIMPSMTFLPRRSRLAAAALLALIALAAQGQTEAPAAAPTNPAPLVEPAGQSAAAKATSPAQPSAMSAELFYEVLLGELNAHSDPGTAYGLVLDAARRSRDGKLFQRAVEIALQARSGDSALAAAQAWKETLPDS